MAIKRAVAQINKAAILEILKVPHGVELIGMSYNGKKDEKIQITIEGDPLPVKPSAANAKILPEVKYTILRHWHNAKIEKKDKKNESKTEY